MAAMKTACVVTDSSVIGVVGLTFFICATIFINKMWPTAKTTEAENRGVAYTLALLTAATFTILSCVTKGALCSGIENFILVWGAMLGGTYAAKGY